MSIVKLPLALLMEPFCVVRATSPSNDWSKKLTKPVMAKLIADRGGELVYEKLTVASSKSNPAMEMSPGVDIAKVAVVESPFWS